MIDEYWTWQFYGYYSSDLKTHSNQPIVVMCDMCCQYRVIRNDQYHDLCQPCSVSVPPTQTHRDKLSKSGKRRFESDEEHIRLSCTKQGISRDEWTGFSIYGEYCEKFDDACRERIRDKYDHECFVCGKNEKENIAKSGKQRKLAVHHIDMNKDQGCNGVDWKLAPLCMCCHAISHTPKWHARIEYILAAM